MGFSANNVCFTFAIPIQSMYSIWKLKGTKYSVTFVFGYPVDIFPQSIFITAFEALASRFFRANTGVSRYIHFFELIA